MSASYTYGVTPADVAAQIHGVDDTSITTSGSPVIQSDLTTWINDGAARFNAAAKKSGITPGASMDADAHQMIASGVRAYAAHKALISMGREGDAVIAAEREWLAIYAEVANQPQSLGSAYTGGLTVASDAVTDTDREDADGFFDTTDGKAVVW